MTDEGAYEELVRRSREAALLRSSAAILEWEEQTYMPAGGVEWRGDQLALLSRLAHERRTDPAVGDLLSRLEASPLAALAEDPRAVNIREWRRQYDRAVKLPPTLVGELAGTTSKAQHCWAQAKKDGAFAEFAPWLEKVLCLKRQEARCLAVDNRLYDALLEDYEPGATAEAVQSLFDGLRRPLTELTSAIAASRRRVDAGELRGEFPIERQRMLGQFAAAAFGFDFNKGRLDETPHPFCTTLGPADCRITTRYRTDDLADGFFSTLHETGHGLYEQGLPPEQFGTPMGEAASLGVHESQSRLWENLVGRSAGYWRHFMPIVRRFFPSAFSQMPFDRFLAAVNAVEPSLIRVDADQVTYNLHVLIRFELERALLEDSLRVADLPAAWNDAYAACLGVRPGSDREGCLQDVHWSAGLFGYFPTYTLGNLFASQLLEAAAVEIGDLESLHAKGDFAPLLEWLRRNVHRHGSRFRSTELVRQATGAPPDAAAMLRHFRRLMEVFFPDARLP